MEMQELDDEKAELSSKVFSIEKQKRFEEFQKDVKKYIIFVLALPLIGAVGLSIYGALNYEFDLQFDKTVTLPSSNITSCKPGWYGELCDKEVIKCSLDTCSGNGKCEDKQNGFSCKCNLGWIGERCFDENNCISNPCQNGGSCQDIGNDFKCDCPEGWVGKACKHPDFCNPNPCKNNGSCSNDLQRAIYECKCPDQFEGPTCKITYLKEIKMVINNSQEVKKGRLPKKGTKDNIGFKLEQPLYRREKCKTSTFDDFSPGETLIWKDESLGDCEKFKFDSARLSIDFFIETSPDNEMSCPVSVEVVMNDEQNTSFFVDGKDLNCNNGKSKNWSKHTAKIRTFK